MKTYEELQEENRLLRQELAAIRMGETEKSSFGEAVALGDRKEERRGERLLTGNDRYAFYENESYLSFLIGNFRTSLLYRNFRRIYRVFKPTMIVVRMIRYLLIFLTMLQASVVLLFVAFVSLMMLPVLLLITSALSLRILCERHALRKSIGEAFDGKKVLVFFSSGANSAFFDRNMRTLLSEYTVIVVQEGGNLFGDVYADENGKRVRFLTAFRVCHSYYRIRRHYFFYLRKHYFGRAASVSVIY